MQFQGHSHGQENGISTSIEAPLTLALVVLEQYSMSLTIQLQLLRTLLLFRTHLYRGILKIPSALYAS